METTKRVTTESIMARIAHDVSWGGPADWVIGYIDRFVGVLEKPYLQFVRATDYNSVEGIPIHRVVHFRRVSTGVTLHRSNKYSTTSA